jgi:replicative DNA helicase
MSEKPTAHSAERLLLSCLMRGGQAKRSAIREEVSPQMFDRYREAAKAMWDVSDTARPDAHTVKSKMGEKADQVDEIEEVRPAPSTYSDHIEPVKQAWFERGGMGLATKIRESVRNDTHDWMDTVALIEEEVQSRVRKMDSGGDEDLQSTVQTVMRQLEEAEADGVTGLETGFPKLDSVTDGWQDAEVTVIAGRPSMGKTSFALSQALTSALDEGKQVRLHSLEMSREKLVKRMIAQRARVNVRDRPLGDEEWQRIARVAGKISDAPLKIDDQPTITPRQMRARCRQQAHEEGLDLLIVDYLQLLRPPQSTDYGNRNKEVGSIARELKMIAKDLDIPVLPLAQLNRNVESRNPPRPQMSDLRDSGEIEEHSDNICFLYRPEVYGISVDAQGNSTEGMGEIIVSKQRNGPDGRVEAAWVEKCAAWEPLEKRQTESPVGGDGLGPRQDADF